MFATIAQFNHMQFSLVGGGSNIPGMSDIERWVERMRKPAPGESDVEKVVHETLRDEAQASGVADRSQDEVSNRREASQLVATLERDGLLARNKVRRAGFALAASVAVAAVGVATFLLDTAGTADAPIVRGFTNTLRVDLPATRVAAELDEIGIATTVVNDNSGSCEVVADVGVDALAKFREWAGAPELDVPVAGRYRLLCSATRP